MMISIAGREIDEDDEQAEGLLKHAHERKVRPLCLCRKPPPQLQIAHIGEHYFVKRLPRDAGAHALICERFEIPLSLSGKVASAGKSIIDDQRNDGVEIKLAVALQPGKPLASCSIRTWARSSSVCSRSSRAGKPSSSAAPHERPASRKLAFPAAGLPAWRDDRGGGAVSPRSVLPCSFGFVEALQGEADAVG